MDWNWEELKRRSEQPGGGIIGARIRVNHKTMGVYQGRITRIDAIGPDNFKVCTEHVERLRTPTKGEPAPNPPIWDAGGQLPIEQYEKKKIGGTLRPQIDFNGGFAIIFPVGDDHH